MDMMSSILPGIINQFTPQIEEVISQKTGVDRKLVRQGIAMAVPLIIAMLAKKSATPQGQTELGSMLSSQPPAGDLADSIGKFQPKADDPVLGQLFGDQSEQITSALGKSTGMDGSARGHGCPSGARQFTSGPASSGARRGRHGKSVANRSQEPTKRPTVNDQ
jgi:hypothetical protein